MIDPSVPARESGEFERYALLAALTLVILAMLLADRIRTAPLPASLPPADRLLRVRIGGYASTPPVTPPGRTPNPGPPGGNEPPAPPLPAPDRTCVVGAGETLGDISLRELGTSRRATEIAELNGIADINRIRAGQSLRLPPR